MTNPRNNFFYNIEKSAVITFFGIVVLFSVSVIIVLIAPRHIDPSWTQPTNPYQVQMYEVVDPNLYISNSTADISEQQFVHHLKENYTLLAFQENDALRINAPPDLERYVTRIKDHPKLKLTSRLLLLRKVNPQEKTEGYEVFEIYDPKVKDVFSVATNRTIIENWVDTDYEILNPENGAPYHKDPGVVYVLNPVEYRISRFEFSNLHGWKYDPNGKPITSLDELKSHPLGFMSRQELIHLGEHIFAIEGCWYCHTDQTRTLVQDTVLNGSDSYPAPPSAPNEYIYQKITFPGTKRNGPDLSRVGIKRPSRDWHKGHFWSPKTASEGSIMPSFRHFFDNDPRGTNQKNKMGVPNYQFEAVFQYLMTKGTRITPPTEAWWLGRDPVKTKEIIEGKITHVK